jgi:transposase-like protein
VIYTTDAIESINSQLRKIIKTRGHFPSDDAARVGVGAVLALRSPPRSPQKNSFHFSMA